MASMLRIVVYGCLSAQLFMLLFGKSGLCRGMCASKAWLRAITGADTGADTISWAAGASADTSADAVAAVAAAAAAAAATAAAPAAAAAAVAGTLPHRMLGVWLWGGHLSLFLKGGAFSSCFVPGFADLLDVSHSCLY